MAPVQPAVRRHRRRHVHEAHQFLVRCHPVSASAPCTGCVYASCCCDLVSLPAAVCFEFVRWASLQCIHGCPQLEHVRPQCLLYFRFFCNRPTIGALIGLGTDMAAATDTPEAATVAAADADGVPDEDEATKVCTDLHASASLKCRGLHYLLDTGEFRSTAAGISCRFFNVGT